MKKVLSAVAVALCVGAQTFAAHAQSTDARENPAASFRSPVESRKETKPAAPAAESAKTPPATPPAAATPTANTSTTAPTTGATPANNAAPAAGETAPAKVPTPVAPVTALAGTGGTVSAAPPLTSLYRVGVGDVLDIRLMNAPSRESTLFTIVAGGLLEYPLAGEPVPVAGLTTDEIDARLTAKIKVYENPQIVVSVREYASHTVIVSGAVSSPGTKVLRREAVPLYVLLAEAGRQPEAGRATIMRAGGGQTLNLNLADSADSATLVMPGDVINVTAAPPAAPQFFYIGGQVGAPGQKDFHAGMTLTQAVLASGGATRFAGGKVKVSRQAADGRLTTTEFNLKQIQAGKVPDPVLQPGDRIEVTRGGW